MLEMAVFRGTGQPDQGAGAGRHPTGNGDLRPVEVGADLDVAGVQADAEMDGGFGRIEGLGQADQEQERQGEDGCFHVNALRYNSAEFQV
ncbi:hypothetical protein DESC_780218 [Desulfosarcina cetonica]|nr:hypothetical protein DESC_780218 [Desulfosarcina cetonica]